MEPEAVGLVIPRLRNIDVQRLSGGATTAAAVAEAEGVFHPDFSAWHQSVRHC